MNVRLFLRMKRLVQNPPSEARVKLVLGAIVLCLALFALERIFGVPDWLAQGFDPGAQPRR